MSWYCSQGVKSEFWTSDPENHDIEEDEEIPIFGFVSGSLSDLSDTWNHTICIFFMVRWLLGYSDTVSAFYPSANLPGFWGAGCSSWNLGSNFLVYLMNTGHKVCLGWLTFHPASLYLCSGLLGIKNIPPRTIVLYTKFFFGSQPRNKLLGE